MKLPKGLNIICLFLFIYSAQSQQPQRHEHQQQSHQQRHSSARKIQQMAKTRKIYAMCPPSFTKIGNECYHLSSNRASWLDSHFECKDKNSKLAEPIKYSDRLLRKYFMERGKSRDEIWIGGMYNWQRMKWQWGYNGKEMTYQSFSQMKPGGSEDLKFTCAVLNPELKYRWSAKLCFEKHLYLCQHRMPYVSERSRHKVYAKWNETFPGQLANEIQVYVTTNGTNRREFYRATSKRPNRIPLQPRRDQVAQASNQVPSMSRYNGVISNEINPPEVFSSRDAANHNKLRRNKKQQVGRDKLKLTGNVDLGKDVRKQLKRKNTTRRPSKPPTTTTTHNINTISEEFQPNHQHRHNHYDSRPQRVNHKPPQELTTPATPSTVTYRIETTTRTAITHPPVMVTEMPASIDNSTLSEMALKLAEKKKRVEKIRQKLSGLTDEEKHEYLRIKAERKKLKIKSINDTTP